MLFSARALRKIWRFYRLINSPFPIRRKISIYTRSRYGCKNPCTLPFWNFNCKHDDFRFWSANKRMESLARCTNCRFIFSCKNYLYRRQSFRLQTLISGIFRTRGKRKNMGISCRRPSRCYWCTKIYGNSFHRRQRQHERNFWRTERSAYACFVCGNTWWSAKCFFRFI